MRTQMTHSYICLLSQDALPRKKNQLQPKMKINDIKTEFLIIGTKQQLNKVNIKTLSVGDSAVAPAASAIWRK